MNVWQRRGWLMIWGGIVAFIGIVVLFGHFAHITPWGTVEEDHRGVSPLALRDRQH